MKDLSPIRPPEVRELSDSRPSHPDITNTVTSSPDNAADVVRRFSTRRRLAGAALLGAALLVSFGLSATHLDGDTGNTTGLLEGVEFSGIIEPRQRLVLTSPSGGVVRSVLVEIGESVVAGQPLVEIDNPSLRDALTAAETDYQVAAAEVSYRSTSVTALDRTLDEISTALTRSIGAVALAQRAAEQIPGRQLRDSPERAQASLDQAISKLQRTRRLHEQGLVSDEALEDQVFAVRIAENDLDNARQWQVAAAELRKAQEEQGRQQLARSSAEFQQQRIDQRALLAQAESRLDQARRRVEAAARAIEESVITADSDGVVVDISAKVGDRPAVGTALVTVAQLEHMMINVPIAPQLVNVLQPGQRATVILPTMPARRVDGRIGMISPMPGPNMTHRVEVYFSNDERRLLSGQPAHVIFYR